MNSHGKQNAIEDLAKRHVEEPLRAAARNAAKICLKTKPEDRVVLIYDNTTVEVAAALFRAFKEIPCEIQIFDLDSFGERPLERPPGVVLKALNQGTVSAMAVAVMRGEISVRRAILGVVAEKKLRHAHMPAITTEVFQDGLAVDYTEVSRFIARLARTVAKTDSLTATSAFGTDLEFRYPHPPQMIRLDGMINGDSWQNLPSGQLIIEPADAEGVYVVDNVIGDWFEAKYDVSQYPVTLEFEKGYVRRHRCDNARLERDLGIFLRSSPNSGRISELVIGANLGLKKRYGSSLYQNHYPGVSISLGRLPGMTRQDSWSSKTFLPVLGKGISLFSGELKIMTDDAFVAELLDPQDTE